jgi:microcystin-dependent protein
MKKILLFHFFAVCFFDMSAQNIPAIKAKISTNYRTRSAGDTGIGSSDHRAVSTAIVEALDTLKTTTAAQITNIEQVLPLKANAADLTIMNNNINYVGTIIGEVKTIAGSNVPTNYLLCDGRMLSKTAYSSLYSTISGQFGENADSFRLPDLSNKFVRGGINRGVTGGTDSVTLSVSNMPPLDVSIPVNKTGGLATNRNNPSQGVLATTTANMYSASTPNGTYSGAPIRLDQVGQNAPISITPSYIVLSYIIRAL